MTYRILTAALALCGALGVAGCATMGSGIGVTSHGRHTVRFNWRGTGSVSGVMTASVANGPTYSGRYFQITSATGLSGLGPLWVGWGPEWGMEGDWDDWEPVPQFITHYSGRVVANLASTDGARMRCRFRLIHPAAGMAGGGVGVCERPDGSRIHAQFPG